MAVNNDPARSWHLEVEVSVAWTAQDCVVCATKIHHLEDQHLHPEVGAVPKSDGQVDLPDRHRLLPSTMPWKGATLGQMRDRSIHMASRVSKYMMLRLLPPSFS